MSDPKDDVKMAGADDISSHRESEASKDSKMATSGDEDLGDDIPMTFPQKLMEILNKPENNDIIAWLSHGKGFIIYKKKKFAADLLPKYFKQAKFTSFTRKLNRWGFTRVTRGPETGAYYHKFFIRDEPRLCMQMSCQNIRHYQEQMALEQQQRQQHEAALAAAGQFSPALMATASRFGALGLGGGGLPGLTDMNLLQQQTAIQQLQLEQLQKQQQLQANELVRRAMATQATASATQAHLAAMTSALQGNGSAPAAQQPSPSPTDAAAGAPGDLYMQLLHSKASQMTARPLMMAIQNSLRTAPPNVLASAPALAAPTNSKKSEDSSEGSSGKRAVRRASAA